MNPIGFGNRAVVLVHAPTNTLTHAAVRRDLLREAEDAKSGSRMLSSSTSSISGVNGGAMDDSNDGNQPQSRTKRVVSALFNGLWRRGSPSSAGSPTSFPPAGMPSSPPVDSERKQQQNSNKTLDSKNATPTDEGSVYGCTRSAGGAAAAARPTITLEDLNAVPFGGDHTTADLSSRNANQHHQYLLTFDLLRYAVFATTETVFVEDTNNASLPQQRQYSFSPEVLDPHTAQSVIETHLYPQLYKRVQQVVRTADKKLSSSSSMKKANTNDTTNPLQQQNNNNKVKENDLQFLAQTRDRLVIDAAAAAAQQRQRNSSGATVAGDGADESSFSSSQQQQHAAVLMGFDDDNDSAEEIRRRAATAASPLMSPQARADQLAAASKKVVVSEWSRPATQGGTAGAGDSSADVPLIRLSMGQTDSLLALTPSDHSSTNPSGAEAVLANPNDTPYTLHFYGNGVGRKTAKEEEANRSSASADNAMDAAKEPVVVAAPLASELSHVDDCRLPLPTISSLAALQPLHAPPIVVRLFEKKTEDSVGGSSSNSTNATIGSNALLAAAQLTGNCYDNDDDQGYEPPMATTATAAASATNRSILPCDFLGSGTGGGARLILQQWGRVESAIMCGGGASSSSSSSSPHHRVPPGWVQEVVSALIDEIDAKQRVLDAKSNHHGNRNAKALGGSRGGRSYTRVKFLCFVPFAIAHPQMSRKMNIVLRTTSSPEEGQQQQQHSVVDNSSPVSASPTVPRALMLPPPPPSASTDSSSSSVIPLPIATLDGVVKDMAYIVSLVPKYGS